MAPLANARCSMTMAVSVICLASNRQVWLPIPNCWLAAYSRAGVLYALRNARTCGPRRSDTRVASTLNVSGLVSTWATQPASVAASNGPATRGKYLARIEGIHHLPNLVLRANEPAAPGVELCSSYLLGAAVDAQLGIREVPDRPVPGPARRVTRGHRADGRASGLHEHLGLVTAVFERLAVGLGEVCADTAVLDDADTLRLEFRYRRDLRGGTGAEQQGGRHYDPPCRILFLHARYSIVDTPPSAKLRLRGTSGIPGGAGYPSAAFKATIPYLWDSAFHVGDEACIAHQTVQGLQSRRLE